MGATNVNLAPVTERSAVTERSVGKLHLLLLLGLASGGTLLVATVLLGGVEKLDFQIFIALLLFYASASVTFLVSQAKTGHFPVFDLPVFLTLLCFLRFALVPASAFIDPDYLDPFFHRTEYSTLNWTLFVFVLGMLAFWGGCRLGRKPAALPGTEMLERTVPNQAPLGWAVALAVVSIAAKLYVTRTYGLGYGANLDVYFDNLALMQVLSFFGDLGIYALAIVTIEVCFHPGSALRKLLLAVIFGNEIFWGALSGMKSSLFRSFLLVAAIFSISKARIDKKWIVAVLAGFVVLYPIHDRYRHLLRGGTVDVKRISSLEQAGSTAAQDTSNEESGWQGWLASGWAQTLRRFDLLQSMATVVSLDPWRADHVRGDERWWMLPFYPFVPRFLWPTKPALLRGMRLSIVLGVGRETSTAITYPGDLYMDYGLTGVLIGMFLFGIVVQIITNGIAGVPQKRPLFLYSGLFLLVLNIIEVDAFSVWASLLKSAAILGAMTYLIYGGRRTLEAGGARAEQGVAGPKGGARRVLLDT